MIEKPSGVQRMLQLDRNENFPRSDSHAKSTEFTVNSPLLKNSHTIEFKQFQTFPIKQFKPSQPIHIQERSKRKNLLSIIVTQSSTPLYTEMNRQLQTGMALPPFKRILRKCHKGQQTTVTIPPTNFASFTEIPEEQPQHLSHSAM